MAELTELEKEDKNDFYRLTPLTLAQNIAQDVGYEVPKEALGVGYAEFSYASCSIIIQVNKCTTGGEAEIKVWAGEGELMKGLAWQHIRLLSQTSLVGLIKDLQKETGFEHIPWDRMLKYCGWRAVQLARKGQGIQQIWPSEEDSLTPVYLLEPLLYLNHPTVVFGDYGSLKSLFALIVGYVAQLPYTDNKLGLITRKESCPCLYLDYEDDPLSFRKRWGAVERGFGIEAPMPMAYQRMSSPLADSVETLQERISEEKIKLVIVDSLGPAARGNLNESEPAIKYHEALRSLRAGSKDDEAGITSLTLAHCAKDQLTRKRTIFGSVFFTNLARSVWEVKAEQETGEDEAIISVKHVKANLSRLNPPLGYRFTFTDKSISVAKTDLKDTGLSGELPLRQRINHILRTGTLSLDIIAEQLEISKENTRRTLYRMKEKGEVSHLPDHTWGLCARDI